MVSVDTLESLKAQMIRIKPSLQVKPDVATDYLNFRLRSVLKKRPIWAGLVKPGILTLPDQYNTGTVSASPGSTQIVGTATNWPVNDLINTALPDGIDSQGLQWVTPSSMSGITEDSILLVDSAGNPEIVFVLRVASSQFYARFGFDHNPGCYCQQSSLAGRQMKIPGGLPIYNVNAVMDSTTIIVDNPWSAATATNVAYPIVQIYTTFGCNVKTILSVVDPVYGKSLPVHIPQAQVNATDPRRMTVSGIMPSQIADYGPNQNGRMCYEVWPHVTTRRSLPFQVYQDWPDMVYPHDTPPPFIDGSVLVLGALADAFRNKVMDDDQYVNQATANAYEQRFQAGVADMEESDNAIMQQRYSWDVSALAGAGLGSLYGQVTDRDLVGGNF